MNNDESLKDGKLGNYIGEGETRYGIILMPTLAHKRTETVEIPSINKVTDEIIWLLSRLKKRVEQMSISACRKSNNLTLIVTFL